MGFRKQWELLGNNGKLFEAEKKAENSRLEKCVIRIFQPRVGGHHTRRYYPQRGWLHGYLTYKKPHPPRTLYRMPLPREVTVSPSLEWPHSGPPRDSPWFRVHGPVLIDFRSRHIDETKPPATRSELFTPFQPSIDFA